MAMITERYRPERKTGPFWRILRLVGLAILVSTLVRLVFFESYTIDGSAMLPGAARDELVLANRFTLGLRIPLLNRTKILALDTPDRGDLVFLRHPWGSQSGLAEFFDMLTLSLFGLSDDQGIRLIRVIGIGGDRIRIDEDGIVLVNGQPLARKQTGQIVLRSRRDAGGRWVRQQLDGHELVAADRLPADAVVLPDLVFQVFRESDWRIAQSAPGSAPATPRLYPFPATNAALTGSFIETFLARTLLRGDIPGDKILIQSRDRREVRPDRVIVSHDAAGSLWYACPGEEEQQLIRVDAGVASVIVPEGMIFVLNDLRESGEDSRLWGPVPDHLITGVPLLRIWPFGRMGSLE